LQGPSSTPRLAIFQFTKQIPPVRLRHPERAGHFEEVLEERLPQPGGDGIGVLQERTRIPAE
jgi:hypothetical protein